MTWRGHGHTTSLLVSADVFWLRVLLIVGTVALIINAGLLARWLSIRLYRRHWARRWVRHHPELSDLAQRANRTGSR